MNSAKIGFSCTQSLNKEYALQNCYHQSMFQEPSLSTNDPMWNWWWVVTVHLGYNNKWTVFRWWEVEQKWRGSLKFEWEKGRGGRVLKSGRGKSNLNESVFCRIFLPFLEKIIKREVYQWWRKVEIAIAIFKIQAWSNLHQTR